jgi:hypothetical protein
VTESSVDEQERTTVKVKTSVKSGGCSLNHNKKLAIKSAVKSGGCSLNHNR